MLTTWVDFDPKNGDVAKRFLLIIAVAHLHLHHRLLNGNMVRSENVTQMVVTGYFAVSALTSEYIFEWGSSSSNEPAVWTQNVNPEGSWIYSRG